MSSRTLDIVFPQRFDLLQAHHNVYLTKNYVLETIRNPSLVTTTSKDGGTWKYYLGKRIKDKFYVLVSTGLTKDSEYIEGAYKVLVELVDNDPVKDPFWVLQKLAFQFGYIVRVGGELGKFIHLAEVELNPNEPTTVYQHEILYPREGPKPIIETLFSARSTNANGRTLIRFRNAYCIDLNRYSAWVNGKLDSATKALGEGLAAELKACTSGSEDWKKYEELCVRIFDFLFSSDFSEFKGRVQSRTLSGLDIRDYLVANRFKEDPSFWRMVYEEFGAKHIICEFKNHKDSIGKDEVYQAANYGNDAIGRFGLIFCRRGVSDSGVSAIRNRYIVNKFMTLVCDDGDLMKMIDLKLDGLKPVNLLRDKKEEFEIAFPT